MVPLTQLVAVPPLPAATCAPWTAVAIASRMGPAIWANAMTTTMMTPTVMPAVAIAAAAARLLPRRWSAPTNPASELARTSPMIIGSTTIGTWVASRTPTYSSANAARIRQLHWASRSSQGGSSGSGSVSGSAGPIAATIGPVTAMRNATTGITAKSPTMPATEAPTGSASRTTAGWRSTERP